MGLSFGPNPISCDPSNVPAQYIVQTNDSVAQIVWDGNGRTLKIRSASKEARIGARRQKREAGSHSPLLRRFPRAVPLDRLLALTPTANPFEGKASGYNP